MTNLKNHHGWIVTTPSGSVSLRDLPVSVHETKDKACRVGRASGKPFAVIEAAKFWRTSFGKTVQALTHKRLAQSSNLSGEHNVVIDAIEEAALHRKPSTLTALLNRLREKKAEQRLQAKIAEDTRKRYPSQKERDKLVIAKQMRETGETLDVERSRMADKSHLLQVMKPTEIKEICRATDNHLAHLFSLQDATERLSIDMRSKCHWTPKRIKMLVKSKTLKAILILFRAGKLPEKCRANKTLLKAINLK